MVQTYEKDGRQQTAEEVTRNNAKNIEERGTPKLNWTQYSSDNERMRIGGWGLGRRSWLESGNKSLKNVQDIVKPDNKIIIIIFILLSLLYTIILIIKLSLGRPRRRWEDNIRMDLEEIGINAGNWVDLALDRIIGEPL